MAATITLDAGEAGRRARGGEYVRRGKLNLGTYATGGVAVTRGDFDLPVEIRDLTVRPAAGYVFEFDKANSKILAYRQKDPAAAGGADIPLPEVGNSVNLAAVEPRFEAVGK